MKKLIPFCLVVILLGCGDKKMENVGIELVMLEPLSDKPSSSLPSFLKDLLQPITVDSSDIAFIPEIKIKRLDIDSTKEISLIVPKSSLSEIREKAGTYAYDNLTEDYNEEVPKLITGKELVESSKTKVDIQEVLDKNSTALFLLKDSTSKGKSNNEFTSVGQLREYMQKQLFNRKGTTFKIIYTPPFSTIPTQSDSVNIAEIKKLLSEGKYNSASLICQGIAATSGIDLAKYKRLMEELEGSADKLFKSLQQAGGNNCQLLVSPLSYFVCAYNLAQVADKSRIENKYNSSINYAKKNCGLITLPSLPSNTNTKSPN